MAPAAGVDGDWWLPGPAAAPGMYHRIGGVWTRVLLGVVTGQSGTVIGSDAIAFSDATWVLTSILPAANVDRVDLRVDFPPVRNLYHISLTQLRTLSAAVAGGNVSESNSVPLSRTWFYDRAYNLSSRACGHRRDSSGVRRRLDRVCRLRRRRDSGVAMS